MWLDTVFSIDRASTILVGLAFPTLLKMDHVTYLFESTNFSDVPKNYSVWNLQCSSANPQKSQPPCRRSAGEKVPPRLELSDTWRSEFSHKACVDQHPDGFGG